MKILINGRVYDPSSTPIAIVINPQDKNNIANMPDDKILYLAIPETFTEQEVQEFSQQAQILKAPHGY